MSKSSKIIGEDHQCRSREALPSELCSWRVRSLPASCPQMRPNDLQVFLLCEQSALSDDGRAPVNNGTEDIKKQRPDASAEQKSCPSPLPVGKRGHERRESHKLHRFSPRSNWPVASGSEQKPHLWYRNDAYLSCLCSLVSGSRNISIPIWYADSKPKSIQTCRIAAPMIDLETVRAETPGCDKTSISTMPDAPLARILSSIQ